MTPASSVIDDAVKLLMDDGSVRWRRSDLLGWLNDGQLQIVIVRPDAKTTTGPIVLVEGPLQRIPTAGLRLMDITRNTGGRGVTMITRQQLNDLTTAWFTTASKSVIKHYAFDERFPKQFHTFPPAAAGASVEGRYSVTPTACATEAANIDLDDTYKTPLIDYICYRAFLRDGESPSNLNRSNAFMQAFMLGLTGKLQADQATKPRRSPE